MATAYDRVNSKYLDFDKIRQRGNFYFTVTKYKDDTLTIETPALVTPTGIQSDASRNWMDLELDVAENASHQKLYDMFKSIDDACIDETIHNMEKWFPKSDVDETFIEEQYKSPVTAGWGNEPALLRIEIGVENPEDLTDAQGNVISPSDVTALSQVVVTMQLLGMWVSEKFLGCHWRATRIVANLDHESKGRRRSSSPRRQSPLPPVTARGGASRRKEVDRVEDEEKEVKKPQTQSRKPVKAAAARGQNATRGQNANAAKGQNEEAAPPKSRAPKTAPKQEKTQAAPKQEPPKRSVKEDPKIQQMLDKLRDADSESDSEDHRRRHSSEDDERHNDRHDDRYDDRHRRRHESDSDDDSDRDHHSSHSKTHYSSRHRRHSDSD